jgi:exopolysaccharide biosynthesis polyprenyl glycosylphosphotransferase
VLLLADEMIRGAIHVGSYKVYGLLIVGAIGLHALMLTDRRKDAFGIAVDDDISAALGKTLFVSFVLFAYLAATKDHSISRVFLFTYLALLFVALLLLRKVSARLLGPILFNRSRRCGTIVIGGAQESERAAAWVESKADLGMETLGWLPTSQQDPGSTKLPKLGSLLQLEEILQAGNASVVLVADFLKTRVHLPWLRTVCDRYGVRLAFNVDFGESIPCSISCYQDGDVNVVTLRDEPLESPLNRALKRLLDIAIAAPVVVLVLPVLAAVVRLAQLRQAPGPLFFRQQRVGLRGKSFSIYKFRTMKVDNPNEAVQVQVNDNRIYPAGKWFRRLSVDEFPQFINVLQGNMSVVGPRPHMELHDSNFAKVAPAYKLRSLIKPGITGLAQVRGFRGPTTTVRDVESRANSDLYYVENWSLKLDLLIISRTFLQFLRQCGS